MPGILDKLFHHKPEEAPQPNPGEAPVAPTTEAFAAPAVEAPVGTAAEANPEQQSEAAAAAATDLGAVAAQGVAAETFIVPATPQTEVPAGELQTSQNVVEAPAASTAEQPVDESLEVKQFGMNEAALKELDASLSAPEVAETTEAPVDLGEPLAPVAAETIVVPTDSELPNVALSEGTPAIDNVPAKGQE